jgi:hypothetical protein
MKCLAAGITAHERLTSDSTNIDYVHVGKKFIYFYYYYCHQEQAKKLSSRGDDRNGKIG